jgi:hypothetical protein
MIAQLIRIARQCDCVRCDMAMLVLPDVFERTWGLSMRPFWPAAVAACRQVQPEFTILGEVYWDLEGEMLGQGFDYTYDKSLYDDLVDRKTGDLRLRLSAPFEYQRRMGRFLENHDEPRAAATFSPESHRAAAAITYLAPGLRFFQHGQLAGARIRPSVHLRRRAAETPDVEIEAFYGRLLELLRSNDDQHEWQLLWPFAAWAGNETHRNFVSFAWGSGDRPSLLVAVNYSDHRSQCYVPMPFASLAGKMVTLSDAFEGEVYERSGDDLLARGLYLDVPAWKAHAFRFRW